MNVSNKDQLVKTIIETWAEDEPKFKELEAIVLKFLDEEITSTELFPYIFHRRKDAISMVKTALKKGKSYEEIFDKLGFRIVTHFKSDLNVIREFLYKCFNVVNYESKAEKLKVDQLGYVSDHFEVRIKPELPQFAPYLQYEVLVFEIQVRTICQHAWADVEHELAYKQDIELDDITKRKIFRLTSLLEICDDEFDSVNADLLGRPEFLIFYVIKKLEGKFYKFAKRRYDRELSFDMISRFQSLLGGHSEIPHLMKLINDFVVENEIRIKYIFSERQEEFQNNIFLSQPEIFLIWYMIEKREHDFVALWQNNYDLQELYELSLWWGKPITI